MILAHRNSSRNLSTLNLLVTRGKVNAYSVLSLCFPQLHFFVAVSHVLGFGHFFIVHMPDQFQNRLIKSR